MTQSTLFDLPTRIDRSAEISDCGRYRWWLRRSWQTWDGGQSVPGKGVCCFIMLNPSTADGTQDDPTIRRCIGFCRAWGYNTLSVRNLFPWRATDPKDLVVAAKAGHDITGGHRGQSELLAVCTANLTIVAWGGKSVWGHGQIALASIRQHFPAVPLYCLGTTKDGSPRHPLYVKADTQPILFTNPTRKPQ